MKELFTGGLFSFPPFVLTQKVEPKVQGKPKPLRVFCRPTHNGPSLQVRRFSLGSNLSILLFTSRQVLFFVFLFESFAMEATAGAVFRLALFIEKRVWKLTRNKALEDPNA